MQVEELFKIELRKILEPLRKANSEAMGKLLFKGVTQYGLPLDVSTRVLIAQEKENRMELFNKVKEDVEWRMNCQRQRVG